MFTDEVSLISFKVILLKIENLFIKIMHKYAELMGDTALRNVKNSKGMLYENWQF